MDKIPVAILGATGAVGQRFVQLLNDHPWFEISALTGSERTVGGVYQEVCRWVLDEDIPAGIGEMIVSATDASLPARLVFSALPSRVAQQVEPVMAEAGYIVCSNASTYRQIPDIPLIIPEVNSNHLAMLEYQRENRGWPGLLVTSPNCTATGLVIPLKPLHDAFGVAQVFVTTMQAVSWISSTRSSRISPGRQKKFRMKPDCSSVGWKQDSESQQMWSSVCKLTASR